MNKLLILILTASAAFVSVPAHAGRDGAQLLMQEKANKEAVARRQCAREVAKLLEQSSQAPQRASSTDETRADEAKRKEEIAACIEKLKKGN